MATNRAVSPGLRLSGYIVLFLLLLLAGGLLAINYMAGLALLLGMLLAWPAKIIFQTVLAWARSLGWPAGVWLALAALIGVLLLCFLFILRTQNLAGITGDLGLDISEAVIKEYRGIIQPTNRQLTNFSVVEEVTISHLPSSQEILVRLPERQIDSTSYGFLLREVTIRPLGTESAGEATLTLPDGTSAEVSLCCPQARVELLDIPKNSFHTAKEARNVEIFPYVDTETITWSPRDLRRGVTFAYIPPPYHYLRPMLTPFIGLSSLSGWIITLLGFAGSILIVPVVEAVWSDLAAEKVKAWLEPLWKKDRTSRPPSAPADPAKEVDSESPAARKGSG